MFGIFKKKLKSKAHIFKVQYVLSATIDPSAGKAGTVTFDLDHLIEVFVKADSLMEAQAIFASKHMLTPHIYVHNIKQIDIVNCL